MSHRAVEVLSSAALVIAEDTRHSRRLLDHYGIRTPLLSYHEHNEAKAAPKLVSRLRAGDSIALISDAGTPLISDPGSRLVAAALEANVKIVPIEIVDSTATVALFEAANRVAATLEALVEAGAGARQAVLARELTKQFEEFKRGTVAELASVYSKGDPKGEVVLMIARGNEREISKSDLENAAEKLRASGKSPREVMDHLVSMLGASRNAAYRIAHHGET